MKKTILILLVTGFVIASCSNGGGDDPRIKKSKEQNYTQDTIHVVVDSAHILVGNN